MMMITKMILTALTILAACEASIVLQPGRGAVRCEIRGTFLFSLEYHNYYSPTILFIHSVPRSDLGCCNSSSLMP